MMERRCIEEIDLLKSEMKTFYQELKEHKSRLDADLNIFLGIRY